MRLEAAIVDLDKVGGGAVDLNSIHACHLASVGSSSWLHLKNKFHNNKPGKRSSTGPASSLGGTAILIIN